MSESFFGLEKLRDQNVGDKLGMSSWFRAAPADDGRFQSIFQFFFAMLSGI